MPRKFLIPDVWIEGAPAKVAIGFKTICALNAVREIPVTVTAEEIARSQSVSVATVHNWVRRGLLKKNSLNRFLLTDVKNLLEGKL